MCRFLLVKSQQEIEIFPFLEKFAFICKKSKVYQGHGWGLAGWKKEGLFIHKSIKPVWKDSLCKFGQASFFLVHARSAFMNRDIMLKHNMPFWDGKYLFAFNGELRGVKLKARGETGAEKLFSLIKTFENGNGNLASGIRNSIQAIKSRTRRIKAINLVISDLKTIYLYSYFTEDPDYFTLYFRKEAGILAISSEPLPEINHWERIENDKMEVFK